MTTAKILMTRLITLAVLVGTIAGCGGATTHNGTANSNDAKIRQAQRNETDADALHATLQTKLSLHHYAGVDDVFDLATVGTCSIDGISTGDQATLYADDPDALNAPDGSATVQVTAFQGTDTSECLAAVKSALGW